MKEPLDIAGYEIMTIFYCPEHLPTSKQAQLLAKVVYFGALKDMLFGDMPRCHTCGIYLSDT